MAAPRATVIGTPDRAERPRTTTVRGRFRALNAWTTYAHGSTILGMSIDDATSTEDLAREDIIDLRDLDALRDSLRARATCGNCDEPAHENTEAVIVHDATGEAECAGEDAAGYVAELFDMLDADELALLAEIDRFEAEELSDDLWSVARNEPSLTKAGEPFEDYAREYAEDIGLVEGDRNPLARFIDWKAWAEHLATDYTEVTLAGETYLHRQS